MRKYKNAHGRCGRGGGSGAQYGGGFVSAGKERGQLSGGAAWRKHRGDGCCAGGKSDPGEDRGNGSCSGFIGSRQSGRRGLGSDRECRRAHKTFFCIGFQRKDTGDEGRARKWRGVCGGTRANSGRAAFSGSGGQ